MNQEIVSYITSICVIGGLILFFVFVFTWQQIIFLRKDNRYLSQKICDINDELRELKYKMLINDKQ